MELIRLLIHTKETKNTLISLLYLVGCRYRQSIMGRTLGSKWEVPNNLLTYESLRRNCWEELYLMQFRKGSPLTDKANSSPTKDRLVRKSQITWYLETK